MLFVKTGVFFPKPYFFSPKTSKKFDQKTWETAQTSGSSPGPSPLQNGTFTAPKMLAWLQGTTTLPATKEGLATVAVA